eukprot:1223365-Prymnesium_polylepis.2
MHDDSNTTQTLPSLLELAYGIQLEKYEDGASAPTRPRACCGGASTTRQCRWPVCAGRDCRGCRRSGRGADLDHLPGGHRGPRAQRRPGACGSDFAHLCSSCVAKNRFFTSCLDVR